VTADDEPLSPFLRALAVARDLGRADARLAADVEPAGEPAPIGPWCHGLAPEDLARLVWDGDGPVPAGLVLNAPPWYAQGFREALAGAGAALPRPRPGEAVPGGDRRPPDGGGTAVRPPAPRRPADGGGGGVPGPHAGRAGGPTAPRGEGPGSHRTGAR
jgi:hypothetical protein